MQLTRVLGLAALALGAVSAASAATATTAAAYASPAAASNATAACTSARVRKPWESLSRDEQALYVEALELAIKQGVIKDLSAMHVETMGETQAHHSCAFFSWHRRMLLAFESYLRDLAPKFACLTIPYYDVHAAYVRAANKQCKSLYDCSPIFHALGGSASGDAYAAATTLAYNGETVRGYAVRGAPFSVDCDDAKAACGAMLRNNIEQRAVPSGAGFGTFVDIVTRSRDYAAFLENVQFGIHNEVHNAVGGVMATFASPRDVFFFSWHGAIDMYLSVFHQCHVGEGGATASSSSASAPLSPQAFSLATQTCGGVSGVGADSKVVMNVKVDGKLVDASQHPLLGKYFASLGDTMGHFADTTTLGEYSYSYELPAIFRTQILANKDLCKGSTSTSVAQPAPGKNETTTTTTTAPVGKDGSLSGANDTTITVPATSNNATVTVAPHSGIVVVPANGTATPAPSAKAKAPAAAAGAAYGFDAAYGDDDSDDDVAYGSGSAYGSSSQAGSPAAPSSEATSGAYWGWVQKTYAGLVERFHGDMAVVAQQMRVIECLAFDKVFGVAEFSDDFVKNFHLASRRPVCGQQVEAVASGNLTVAVEVPATTAFAPEQVTFAAPAVIEVVRKQAAEAAAKPSTGAAAPQIDAAYIKTAEKTLQEAAAAAVSASKGDTRGAAKPAKSKKHKLCH